MAEQAQEDALFAGSDQKFKELVKACNVYAEYGCGESTEWVMRNCSARILSVDSSRTWIDKVKSSVGEIDTDRLMMHAVDLGKIMGWGRPGSYRKRDNIAEYRNWIWEQGYQPDVVLVDGRFRVACFLTSLLHAVPGTKIIFDDYAWRGHYHVVEEIIPDRELSGRQAIFEVPEFDSEKRKFIERLADKFEYVME